MRVLSLDEHKLSSGNSVCFIGLGRARLAETSLMFTLPTVGFPKHATLTLNFTHVYTYQFML